MLRKQTVLAAGLAVDADQQEPHTPTHEQGFEVAGNSNLGDALRFEPPGAA